MPGELGTLVLAAGGSTRFGSPKQLFEFEGRPLVCRAVQSALDAGPGPVIVVLGAHANECAAALCRAAAPGCSLDPRVMCVLNATWERGLGASIRTGMGVLAAHPIDAALLTLCDQPRATAASLARLRAAWSNSPDSLIAARYAGAPGVPAIFPRRAFADLAQLPDDSGAKPLLHHYVNSLLSIDMPEAAFDIDAPADLV
jgi:molybdenum cofactor cytidylyltransferase